MWSAWQGLFSRNFEGKKGDLLSDDLDEIAERLLGKGHTSEDLGSVESILQALPRDEAQALLDRAKQDPNWKEVTYEGYVPVKQVGSLDWFKHIATKLS